MNNTCAYTKVHLSVILALLGTLLAPIPGLARQELPPPPDEQDSNRVFLPVVTHGFPTDEPGSGATTDPVDYAAIEQEVARLINLEREQAGLPRLTLSNQLTEAARRHSWDMAENDFVGHMGSDGADLARRLREAGYRYMAAGEILVVGFDGDPERAVFAWMNSDGHRGVILSDRYVEFGVGYAYDPASQEKFDWTVDFGKRMP